jgi:Flp pilus assembly protein TadG
MKFKRKKKKESGQAIVEFLIVISIILTLIFVFVQLAWAIAYGHYAHYITYMAARAYYAGGVSKQEQTAGAVSVLRVALKQSNGQDLLPFIAKARKADERDIKGSEPIEGAFVGMHPEALGKDNSRAFSWAEGVQYNFSVNLFLLPLAKWVTDEGKGRNIKAGSTTDPTKAVEWKGAIPFTSDAFLGREPSVDECFREMTRLSRGTGIQRADGAEFLEDNGC